MEAPPEMNTKAGGYRGLWYWNQKLANEYRYKYSGGLGTYCAKHVPLAVHAPEANKTFFCYGGASADGKELLAMVSCYDHKTGTVPRPTVLMNKHTDDLHDNVVISLDGRGHIWAFVSAHGTARPAYVFKSRRPHSVEEFDLMRETNFSYPQPWHIPGEGFLFLHTKYGPFEGLPEWGRKLCWMTSRDGLTWSERRALALTPMGHYQISWPCGTKVGTAFNVHPAPEGLNWRTNLYYLETPDMGDTWATVSGQTVKPPLTEVRNEALVHDYRSEGLLVYLKDVNYDRHGNPVILYVTSKGWEPGPENAPRTWATAHWTGRAWSLGRITESDSNYDTGCIHVEPDATWRVIGPTEVGPQPYNPGGEVAVWVSGDRGKTWRKERQITEGSPYNHTYVRRPVNAHPGFYAFWADGHGRRRSESRFYFYDAAQGRVCRLPYVMEDAEMKPEPVSR